MVSYGGHVKKGKRTGLSCSISGEEDMGRQCHGGAIRHIKHGDQVEMNRSWKPGCTRQADAMNLNTASLSTTACGSHPDQASEAWQRPSSPIIGLRTSASSASLHRLVGMCYRPSLFLHRAPVREMVPVSAGINMCTSLGATRIYSSSSAATMAAGGFPSEQAAQPSVLVLSGLCSNT